VERVCALESYDSSPLVYTAAFPRAVVEVEVRSRPEAARGTDFAAACRNAVNKSREAANEEEVPRPGVEPGTPR
jgi:hypothetical protein